VPVRLPTALQELLSRRAIAGRDPVELAREAVDAGCLVALEGGDARLVERIRDAGLAGPTELTVETPGLAAVAVAAGISVAVAGAVGPPGARIVVRSDAPDAEERCRSLADGRVRLVRGHGRAGELSFVRCLNVLMAAQGHPGIEVSDPRLIAIAGERAAWNGRPSDSWELVMPYGVLVAEQRRLVAAGSVVRVAVGGRP
jgi:hypothetical protein